MFTVTLDELQTIADNLRPYTADAKKIEVAPWIREYVVDMEHLYTELTLEKIYNKVAKQDVKVLNHYSELFNDCEYNKRVENPDYREQESSPVETSRKSHICKSKQIKSKKILMKADPGMGKTTQCKKISWDWAMILFTYFHVVFLVFLKLVKPGDVIENVIIKQNPYMKGLEITEQKVRSILQLLGSNSLLILDGLDEHALGTNGDVLSIIRGEKYLKCNIIVTSRPHSTRDIERYFPTVVRVEGFTKNKAKQFASKILSDDRKIDNVLSFRPSDFREDIPIQKCPILLSFICLLIREDEIDLSGKTIHIGELYTRMVRCLYKKFTIRKGIEFKICEFLKVLKLLGKLALQTLLSGKPLLRRNEVIKQVGPYAFEYGLLIGNEDAHRLIGDETADIWVTFSHRAIQEFLGALYFCVMLDEGQQTGTIPGRYDAKRILMINPLFLQFCLWLVHNGKTYFNFERGDDMYNHLRDFFVTKLNREELDLMYMREAYETLNVKLAYDRNDKLHLNFLSNIFANCDRTSHLIISEDDPLDWVLNSMVSILKEVTCITWHAHIGEILISYVTCTDIVLNIRHLSFNELSPILKICTMLAGNRSVYLYLDDAYSLPEKSFTNLKRLSVTSQNYDKLDLSLQYPNLTHLCLRSVNANENNQSLFDNMCEAASRGHFPLLCHLSLAFSRETKLRLQPLFQLTWPRLMYLNLLNSDLTEIDFKALCLACNSLVKTLPNLTSLFLSIPKEMTGETLSSNLFALPWVNLQTFYIDLLYALARSEIHDSLCDAIASGKLQHLKSLCLRDSQSKIQIPIPTLLELTELGFYACQSLRESMFSLFSQQVQLLETLTLQRCGLNSQDLITLTKVNLEDRLPNLRHLDLSLNVLSEFGTLFGDSCTWNQLLSLNIMNSFGSSEADNVLDDLNTVVGRGGLSSLQRLGIDYYKNTDTIWPKLEKIHGLHCFESVLSNIIKIRSHFLKELHTLCILHHHKNDARLTRKLSAMGVSCHQFCAPWDDPFRKCHCEET